MRLRISQFAELLSLVILAAAMFCPSAGWAGPSSGAFMAPLVVTNDRGGSVKDRIELFKSLQSSGQPVEIRGSCYSSCTMYLGLDNVCVASNAKLAFHGPSYLDHEMPQERFDHWTRLMAGYYPPAIARWFMSEARYVRGDENFLSIRGKNLIEHGIQACM